MFYKFSINRIITPMERKKYITSLIGAWGQRGTIDKFNNAIGFKAVNFDVVEHTFPSDELYPEVYKSPSVAILEAMRVVLEDDIVVCFDVHDENIVHPQQKYSYNTREMFSRFVKFVNKVYPEIIVTEINPKKNELVDKIFRHFYICFAEGDNITTECSSHRLLDEEEKKYILDNLRQITSEKIEIHQFYCETCASYDENSPYHIEIEQNLRKNCIKIK